MGARGWVGSWVPCALACAGCCTLGVCRKVAQPPGDGHPPFYRAIVLSRHWFSNCSTINNLAFSTPVPHIQYTCAAHKTSPHPHPHHAAPLPDFGSDDGSGEDDDDGGAGQKPLPHVLRAADALAAGGIPEQPVEFDTVRGCRSIVVSILGHAYALHECTGCTL